MAVIGSLLHELSGSLCLRGCDPFCAEAERQGMVQDGNGVGRAHPLLNQPRYCHHCQDLPVCWPQ